jgi:iron complex transport system permease protein
MLFAILWPMGFALSRQFDQSVLDDETATGTGLSVIWLRSGAIILAVGLTASAVSFVGGIAFVGLVAPHAAQALAGLHSRIALILTPILGASMVLGADIIARTVASPLELPTGAITALVGAPYFVFLLIRQARHA